MQAKEQRLLFWLTFIGALLVTADVVMDVVADGWNLHVMIEAIILSVMAILMVRNVFHNFQLRERLKQAHADLDQWKGQNAAVLRDLEAAIDRQFEAWHYTRAEKEIATYLLKGMSARQIAEARASSEKTVRQQCTSVYQKSGLAGRSELSAYFLEALLSEPRAGQL